jgi:hypothetical protein
MRFLTLDSYLETMPHKELVQRIEEIAEHEEIKKSEPHSQALAHVLDLLKHPRPQAWRVSSDSDVLRCPHCLMRVPGDNPWREGDKIRPMNILACHGDTIYEWGDTVQCPGCGMYLEPRTLDGEVCPKAKGEHPELMLVASPWYSKTNDKVKGSEG